MKNSLLVLSNVAFTVETVKIPISINQQQHQLMADYIHKQLTETAAQNIHVKTVLPFKVESTMTFQNLPEPFFQVLSEYIPINQWFNMAVLCKRLTHVWKTYTIGGDNLKNNFIRIMNYLCDYRRIQGYFSSAKYRFFVNHIFYSRIFAECLDDTYIESPGNWNFENKISRDITNLAALYEWKDIIYNDNCRATFAEMIFMFVLYTFPKEDQSQALMILEYLYGISNLNNAEYEEANKSKFLHLPRSLDPLLCSKKLTKITKQIRAEFLVNLTSCFFKYHFDLVKRDSYIPFIIYRFVKRIPAKYAGIQANLEKFIIDDVVGKLLREFSPIQGGEGIIRRSKLIQEIMVTLYRFNGVSNKEFSKLLTDKLIYSGLVTKKINVIGLIENIRREIFPFASQTEYDTSKKFESTHVMDEIYLEHVDKTGGSYEVVPYPLTEEVMGLNKKDEFQFLKDNYKKQPWAKDFEEFRKYTTETCIVYLTTQNTLQALQVWKRLPPIYKHEGKWTESLCFVDDKRISMYFLTIEFLADVEWNIENGFYEKPDPEWLYPANGKISNIMLLTIFVNHYKVKYSYVDFVFALKSDKFSAEDLKYFVDHWQVVPDTKECISLLCDKNITRVRERVKKIEYLLDQPNIDTDWLSSEQGFLKIIRSRTLEIVETVLIHPKVKVSRDVAEKAKKLINAYSDKTCPPTRKEKLLHYVETCWENTLFQEEEELEERLIMKRSKKDSFTTPTKQKKRKIDQISN